MITTRDLSVIEFLETYKIASTSILKNLFFVSASAAYKRLNYLYKHKEINRIRNSQNSEYLYYHKKRPATWQHALLVSTYYSELQKVATIKSFKIEVPFGDIRPDAIVAYEFQNKKLFILLEVEISHKMFDFEKYSTFYSTGEYRKYFPIMPQVVIVSDTVKLPINSPIKYKLIPTNFDGFTCY